MILFIYLLLNGIALLFFIKKKKNLHILELTAYWFLASYIAQNFSALCYMNFKTIHIPEVLPLEISHFISRTNLYPVIMVLFLDYYLVTQKSYKKGLLMILFVAILTSIEWLNHFLGVFIHVNWQFWWSPAVWFGALILLISFMKGFRILLFKGGQYK
jgi:hypothetical protein